MIAPSFVPLASGPNEKKISAQATKAYKGVITPHLRLGRFIDV